MKEEEQQQREIEAIYNEMFRWCEQEVNAFYGKYADAEGIDITDAKKRVTQADIESYEALAKEYVKNKDFSPQANAEMRLYNATMKINRLEMLKARIGVHLVDGINSLDEYYEKTITDRTRREIERQAGILGETVTNADATARAKQIVNASFFNATYSERIWSHADNLKSNISIELQKGLIAGVGSRQMASNLRKQYDVSARDAHRLMVTELRRVQTDVAMDSYKREDIQRYVFLAVNPRACPICRALDGKDFLVSEAEPALNAPPMHPNCHCTTAPYVDEEEYNAWLNYLSQGGSTSDWNQMSLAERQKYNQNVVQSTTTNDIVTRQDAERILKDEIGFDRIEPSFANIPDDVAIEQTKQLRKLENIFGMVKKSVATYISGTNDRSTGTLAFVRHSIKDPNRQSLTLCQRHFQGLQSITDSERKAVNSKWSMPCSESELIHYTVTHEYGHMVHNVLLSQELDSFDTFKTRATTLEGKYKSYEKYSSKTLGEWDKEIIQIAKDSSPSFSLSDNLSRYGKTNNAEFFAEVFANSQCGEPNELGIAMQEWLRRRGYDT